MRMQWARDVVTLLARNGRSHQARLDANDLATVQIVAKWTVNVAVKTISKALWAVEKTYSKGKPWALPPRPVSPQTETKTLCNRLTPFWRYLTFLMISSQSKRPIGIPFPSLELKPEASKLQPPMGLSALRASVP